MNLNETAVFVAVARAESFTKAGLRLGVPTATVSRQVARLEERLRARLLHRTTRRVALTDVGRAYFERCVYAIEAVEDAERLVADVSGKVTGTLRVATSFDVARDMLVPWLPLLHSKHPELRIELDLSTRRVDLIAEGFDVAIRGGGPMEDSALIARKIFPSALVLAATPAYLKKHGTPRSVDELAKHDCLAMPLPRGRRWRFTGSSGEVNLELAGWLSVNELGVLQEATAAGLGIGLVEINHARVEIAARRLLRVLPDYQIAGGALWAVYPSSHHLSPKVRVFVDFLAARGQDLARDAALSGRSPQRQRRRPRAR